MFNEPNRFHLIQNEIIDNLIDLNSRAVVHMTKLVLPQMIKK
jgi:NADP-dependent 3-hydroxy acid dehydrogenase YdfG